MLCVLCELGLTHLPFSRTESLHLVTCNEGGASGGGGMDQKGKTSGSAVKVERHCRCDALTVKARPPGALEHSTKLVCVVGGYVLTLEAVRSCWRVYMYSRWKVCWSWRRTAAASAPHPSLRAPPLCTGASYRPARKTMVLFHRYSSHCSGSTFL